jgi:hypothetical protein
MLGRGAVIAEGTIEELARSRDETVFHFFHRIAEDSRGAPGTGSVRSNGRSAG